MLHIPKIRENLLSLLVKTKRFLLISPRITSAIFIIGVFVIASVITNKNDFEKPIKTLQSYRAVSPAPVRSTQGKNTKKAATPSPKLLVKKAEISGEITEKKIAIANSPTPTSTSVLQTNQIVSNSSTGSNVSLDGGGLLSAVNSFRSANGALAALNSSGTLCGIAQKRLDELIALGHLDSHAGFSKFFQGQTEFNGMGEIIFSSSSPKSPEYAVNEGWAKSTSGHRENMLDAKWNYGCGATNGYFAVFNFGKK